MKNKRILSSALAFCMTASLAAVVTANAVELVKYGDANADTAINLSDMITVANYLHGKAGNIDLDLADINRDGSVDSLDLVQLRKVLLKSIKSALSDNKLSAGSRNLTAGLTASQSETASDVKAIDDDFKLAHSKFALELLKRQVSDKENVMISPYSIMQAMGMLANGADGESLAQLEDVMGGIPTDTLNKYLKQWRVNQPNEKTCKLSTANSIWAIDDENRIKPRPEFLQTTADQYNAEYYLAPFDDTTLKDINSWINDKTDEMIPKVLDRIGPNEIMYLINAVAFDAKWENPYEKEDIRTYDFNCYNGDVQKAEMLCNTESLIINDDHATGFYKYYKGKKYAFAALLPEEGMTVTEYINSLTPEHLSTLFVKPETPENKWDAMTMVRLPKFKYEYKALLNDTLADMGMTDLFDENKSDLTRMTSVDNPNVSRVIHDTFIQLDEEGTKAAAVTIIATADNAVMMPEKELNFDRPFVYAIVDTETDMPVFMGTLTNIPK